jgi:hypothetical protein
MYRKKKNLKHVVDFIEKERKLRNLLLGEGKIQLNEMSSSYLIEEVSDIYMLNDFVILT